MYNYDELIRESVQPGIEEDVFFKPYEDLVKHFTEDTKNESGPAIVRDIRVSVTSNARNYDKTDVDPIAGSFDTVTAKWTKIFQETAAEVHNIDISNAGSTDAVVALFTDAIKLETNSLWALIFEDVYAQIKLDLLASGGYSDENLNRGTYPTLSPFNEVNAVGITPALMRQMMHSTRLNKNTSPVQGYKILMDPVAYYSLAPQVQLLHTWNVSGVAGQAIDGGWQPIGNFEGSDLATISGSTVGDVFFIRPQDVRIRKHRNMTITTVPSGRDSVKAIIRTGIQAYVINPGLQGMMTNKS
jgi:hypothetical protein